MPFFLRKFLPLLFFPLPSSYRTNLSPFKLLYSVFLLSLFTFLLLHNSFLHGFPLLSGLSCAPTEVRFHSAPSVWLILGGLLMGRSSGNVWYPTATHVVVCGLFERFHQCVCVCVKAYVRMHTAPLCCVCVCVLNPVWKNVRTLWTGSWVYPLDCPRYLCCPWSPGPSTTLWRRLPGYEGGGPRPDGTLALRWSSTADGGLAPCPSAGATCSSAPRWCGKPRPRF